MAWNGAARSESLRSLDSRRPAPTWAGPRRTPPKVLAAAADTNGHAVQRSDWSLAQAGRAARRLGEQHRDYDAAHVYNGRPIEAAEGRCRGLVDHESARGP